MQQALMTADHERRFGGVARLYGPVAAERLKRATTLRLQGMEEPMERCGCEVCKLANELGLTVGDGESNIMNEDRRDAVGLLEALFGGGRARR